jgi:glutamyl-tRNA reductase
MTLAIVHHAPPAAAESAGALSWRTCLRDVTFLAHARWQATDAIAEEDAYQLLLEILCGLRSPMLGETQVMGQFKAFLASVPAEHGWVKRVGQRLLADAGAIREQHLHHLGSRSYGSVVRHRVGAMDRVAIIGAGKLASEVLCFLSGHGRTVDVWGRRPTPPFDMPEGATYRALDDIAEFGQIEAAAAVIVAAPVSSLVAANVAARYRGLAQLIDLRGEQIGGAIDVPAPCVTLQDVFNDMQAARRHAEEQCEAAKLEIAVRSRQFGLRDDRRPFGWDDLCA